MNYFFEVIAPTSKQAPESFSLTHFHLGTTAFLNGYTIPDFIVEKADKDEQVRPQKSEYPLLSTTTTN